MSSAWALLALACMLASGLLEGAWWLSIAAAAALWHSLTRAHHPLQVALLVLVALLPVPAVALDGLRNFHVGLWLAVVLVVAAAYAAAVSVIAHALQVAQRARSRQRGPPRAGVSAMAITLAFFLVDVTLMHARPFPIPFPVTPGYALIDSPWASAAALAGPAALTAVWFTLGVALRNTITAPTLRARVQPWLLAAVTALLLPLAHERALGNPSATQAPITVTLTQHPAHGNPGSIEQWLHNSQRGESHLHIWPENAIANQASTHPEALVRAAQTLQASILTGATNVGPDARMRNVAVLSDGFSVRVTHEKRWLVPHYESHLAPGVGAVRPLVVGGWQLGVVVCWESLFFDEVRARLRGGADALVVLAHSDWARGTLTPHWHARAARLLALTFGRPVVHVGGGGPSRVIAHDGTLVAALDAQTQSQTFTLAPAPTRRTPYAYGGPLGVLLGWCLVATAWVLRDPTRR